MTPKILNTCFIINWDDVISNLERKEPGKVLDASTMTEVLASDNKKIVNLYKKIFELWKDANYYLDSLEWINFYPGIHYDNVITDTVSDYLKIVAKRDWISCILPGKTAPYHWDIDHMHDEWITEGELVRYSCFINKPFPGQVMNFSDSVYHKLEQGDMFLWKDYRDYHSASNTGLKPFFMYHILGIKK